MNLSQNQSFQSPFYIFIKTDHPVDIVELLKSISIKAESIEDGIQQDENEILSCYHNGWTLILDNFAYQLWHSICFRTQLEAASKKYDLFYTWYGDIDESFELVYYSNQQLIRKLSVEDPDRKGAVIKENYGTPLNGEDKALTICNVFEQAFALAKCVGISFSQEIENVQRLKLLNQNKFEFHDEF